MIDHRFGKLLDELDAQDRWDTTAVIVFTHHGHDLGGVRSTGAPGDDNTADIWGKSPVRKWV